MEGLKACVRNLRVIKPDLRLGFKESILVASATGDEQRSTHSDEVKVSTESCEHGLSGEINGSHSLLVVQSCGLLGVLHL